MKRNLFLSLVLLALPLAADDISGRYSPYNGGVAALPNDESAVLTISGSQNYSDCVANGQGGVFAVLADGTLTLHTASGECIEFSDNRDFALPSPTGAGFRGVPNDVYLGKDGRLVLETAANSDIVMNSGIAANRDALAVKRGEGTWTLAGTAEATRFQGYLHVEEGTVVLGEGCVFGSAAGVVGVGGELKLETGAALGVGLTVLEAGGIIRSEQPMNLMPGQTLDVYGGQMTGSLGTYRDSTVELCSGEFSLNGDLKLGGGTIVFAGGQMTVSGNITPLNDTAWEIAPEAYTTGNSYELLRCLGDWSEKDVSLTLPNGSRTHYRTEKTGNSIVLHVTGAEAAGLTWQGAREMCWTSLPDMKAWVDQNGRQDAFYTGDRVSFRDNGSVTIVGNVAPGSILVENDKSLTFVVNRIMGGGICGQTGLTKQGKGVLTLNDGNSYTGDTSICGGTLRAAGATAFGTGEIRLISGTLDMAGKPVANALNVEGEALVKGAAKYTGALYIGADLLKGSAIGLAQTATLDNCTINGVLSGTAGAMVTGKVTFNTKNTYKGETAIMAGAQLCLGDRGGLSGSLLLLGGELDISSPRGLTLGRGQDVTLRGGVVEGLLTIGAGSTLYMYGGDVKAAPVLKGGTVDFGGTSALTLTGSKALVQLGGREVALSGKGVLRTNDVLTVTQGIVTVNAMNGYNGVLSVKNSTLKLATGKETTNNIIEVNGNAAVVNGATHSGNIIVDGMLAKGTTIKLINENQKVELYGTGVLTAAISGVGSIDINASVDATAARLTAANLNLYNGTFFNNKGIRLVKGQTLTLAGANLNLGDRGALTTVAGSTLYVNKNTTITGSLTLGGGELVFTGGSLEVKGLLTLGKPVTVTGSGSITYSEIKPFRGSLDSLFNGAQVEWVGRTLYITAGSSRMLSLDAAAAPAEAPEPEVALAPAPPVPVMPQMADSPLSDAAVQADWGILDAERAFVGVVRNRNHNAARLDKGQGAVWADAFGSYVRHGSKGAHHGADGNIEGAAFGVEHTVGETAVLGLAVGRSVNRLAATGVSHLRQETAHVALYGRKQLSHSWCADGLLAWGDTESKVQGCSWTQKSAALAARLTHAQMLTEDTVFRTFGGLVYEATESGDVAAATRSGSVQNLRAELGAGTVHNVRKAQFFAEASLTGDLVRHNPGATVGGIRRHGANPGRMGVKAELGALYELAPTWCGTVSYSIEAEARSSAHTLNVGVSKSF